MLKNPEKIIAIVPAFNEKGKIGRVVEKTRQTALADLVVAIDDCSHDGTYLEAETAGAVVIRHRKNMGVGAAIRSGIYYGLEHGYDIGVVLSGDDQHHPQEIAGVIEPILKNECDMVQGSRWLKGGKVENERPFRVVMTKLYSLFFTLVTGRKITDATNGFRAFRLSLFKSTINIGKPWLDRYELEPYILFKAVKNRSIRLKEVPITISYHTHRKEFTKMKPFSDWWRIAKPVILLALKLRR